jgi:hypothetical protein
MSVDIKNADTNALQLPQDWMKDFGNKVIVDGELYDLTKFVDKHPGGALFIIRSRARDITVTVNTYHKDIKKVKAVLNKYKIGPGNPRDMPSDYLLPKFLMPKKFDAKENLPSYDFNREGQFQKEVIDAMKQDKDLTKKIKQMDQLFDVVCAALCVFYLALNFAMCTGMVNPWICACLLVAVRTALGGAGHYGLHAAQPDWKSNLFNATYVGYSLTAVDGHTLIHHSFTEQLPDVKRTFFSSMLSQPRIFRFPIHTLRSLALFVSGHFFRALVVTYDYLTVEGFKHHLSFFALYWITRGIMLAEMAACIMNGLFVPWMFQFTVTLWWNMILIVSSHELVKDPESIHDNSGDVSPEDWGLFQIQHANDTIVSGITWIDSFLTAGLACHRVHHLFPFQKSGFANIVSVPIVRKLAAKRGVPWKRSKIIWIDQLPETLNFLVNCPMRSDKKTSFLEENFHPASMVNMAQYVFFGFLGEFAL